MTEKRRGTTPEKRPGTPIAIRHAATNGHGSADVSFLKGLLVGGLVGAAAGILLAPQAKAALRTLRHRLVDTAADIGDAAAERYQEARDQMSEAADDLQEKGRGAYGKVLSAVVRGAQGIQDQATESRADLNRGAPKARRTS